MEGDAQVAGAAAAAGLPLAEVKAAAQAALEHIGTMGVALSGCNVPGSAPSDRCAGRQTGVRAVRQVCAPSDRCAGHQTGVRIRAAGESLKWQSSAASAPSRGQP